MVVAKYKPQVELEVLGIEEFSEFIIIVTDNVGISPAKWTHYGIIDVGPMS